MQSDNENCRKKANTGHESRNAWAMADAAACLEDLHEVTQHGGREIEKKKSRVFVTDKKALYPERRTRGVLMQAYLCIFEHELENVRK